LRLCRNGKIVIPNECEESQSVDFPHPEISPCGRNDRKNELRHSLVAGGGKKQEIKQTINCLPCLAADFLNELPGEFGAGLYSEK